VQFGVEASLRPHVAIPQVRDRRYETKTVPLAQGGALTPARDAGQKPFVTDDKSRLRAASCKVQYFYPRLKPLSIALTFGRWCHL
jgi:hypothetical protein